MRLGQDLTGFEHAVVLREDGSAVWFGHSSSPKRVSTSAWRDRVGPGRVSVHHSHPDSVSLSPADLSVMWLGRSIGVVRTLTPDGGDNRGEPLGDPSYWARSHAKLVLAAGSELRVQSRNLSLNLAYLAHHLANLEMARRGHIWYDYLLSRNVGEDLKRLASVLGQLQGGLARGDV